MGKVILYLAISLDGYIADSNGGFDFLNGYDNLDAYGYQDFLSHIGTIIMGRKSYDLARSLTSTWDYNDQHTYVYTRTPQEGLEKITFTNQIPSELVAKIKAKSDKDIWLFGGGEIIDLFVKEHAIDEYWIYYVAEVLGEGIPLFRTPILKQLNVKSIKQYDNIIEVKLIPKV